MNTDKSGMLGQLKKLQWIMYIIAVLAYMLTLFHRITPSIMGPDLMADLKFGAASFGFMGLAYTWVYAFAQAPVGTMLDNIGARKGITIILILAAVGGIVFSAAQSFPMLVVGRILLALAVSGFMIGGAKVTSAWFTSAQYPLLWGLFMGIGALGSVVATTPLQIAMSTFGWRNAMLAVAIFSLVLAVIAFLILRDAPADKGLLTPDELAGIIPVKEPSSVPEQKESVGTVLRMPILWLIGLISFGGNSAAQVFGGLWEGVYLTSIFGFDKPIIGSIMSWHAWGIVVGCFASGILAKKLGSKLTMTIGVLLAAANWLFITLQPATISIPELKVFNFLLGALMMIVITTTFIFCREVFPLSRLGTAMGFLNAFVWIIAAGAFQQVWGVIIQIVSKGVQPYPLKAFVICMWVQLIMSVIATAAALYVQKSKNIGQQQTKSVEETA